MTPLNPKKKQHKALLTEELFLIEALQGNLVEQLPQSIHWDHFYKLVIRHRVWHQVHAALHQHKHNIPIFDVLHQQCQQNKISLLKTVAETIRLARRFQEHNIEHCFVKGIVLSALIYETLDSRPCRDIDVFIKPCDYERALELLKSMGYQQINPVYELNDSFKKRYFMRHRHDMGFYHPQRKLLVEPHFRLDYFGIQFCPWNQLTQRTIPLLGQTITTLQNDYHLFYLMVHGSIHAWIRLRWLQDIVLFIQKKQCDLNQVMRIAATIQAQHIVIQCLNLVQEFYEIDDPTLLGCIQHSTRQTRKLISLSTQFILGNYEMIDGIKKPILFFKYRYYLSILAIKGQKKSAILGDLFKIDELFKYITLPQKFSFLYYLFYPAWVIFYIIKS